MQVRVSGPLWLLFSLPIREMETYGFLVWAQQTL